MIPRYRLLAARIRAELQTLERSVDQTEGALARAQQQPADESYFVAAVAHLDFPLVVILTFFRIRVL